MTNHDMETFERLVGRVIDETLSDADAVELNALLAGSTDTVRLYEEMLDQHAALCVLHPGGVYLDGLDELEPPAVVTSRPTPRTWSKFLQFAATAAACLLAVGLFGFYTGQGQSDLAMTDADPAESLIAGHAVLTRSVGIEWSNTGGYREGDVLPAGTLAFESGLAEIDLFCGATLVVEGPASFNLKSDWVVEVQRGRLRANVPPAARGFIVRAGDSEVIDLGTEFALQVGPNGSRVEVVDGEVELRGGPHDGEHLVTGESKLLSTSGSDRDVMAKMSSDSEVRKRRLALQQAQFQSWRATSEQLRNDERLIAYYPIASSISGRVLENVVGDSSAKDGRLIGLVGRVDGRFGDVSSGLEFERPGARVRVRIDGDFEAFTFACWARIDSLDHRYNALFMGDGYENGEPHWQIRDDGRLMFSVMVDDSQVIEHMSEMDNAVVKDAGLHRVYMTDPIWDISKSGQWFHIAAVYDPSTRQVRQYVNGRLIADEQIIDKFSIDTLRIGAAEIGNWGQPFRESAWFSVRNLNGAIDEMAIFGIAVSGEEIRELYEQGKPLGY